MDGAPALPGVLDQVRERAQCAEHEQYGAVLQKGSKLLPIVNSTLKTLIANGTVGKLQKKWFNLDFSKIPVLK